MFLILGLAIVAGLISATVQGIGLYKLDALLMDLRQQFVPDPPTSGKIATVTLSVQDRAIFGKDVGFSVVERLLQKIESDKPKAIIMMISPDWLSDNNEDNKYLKLFLNIKNLYLFRDDAADKDMWGTLIGRTPGFGKFPRFFHTGITIDRQVFARDLRRRRVLIDWAENRGPEALIQELNEMIGTTISPTDFKYAFTFLDTKQIFFKMRSTGSYGAISWSKLIKNSQDVRFRNKIVLIDSDDRYSSMDSSPSIFRVLWGGENRLLSSNHVCLNEILANVMDSLIIKSYVKVPSIWFENAFLFGLIFGFLLNIFLLNPIQAAISTTIYVLFVPVIGWALYWATDFMFNLSHPIVAMLGIQYLTVPYLIVRYVRQRDRQSFEERAQAERSLIQSRVVAKSARADLGLKIAMQVAHDLRSPIMAVKAVGDLAKESLPQEMKQVLRQANERLEKLSRELLETYKTGFTGLKHEDQGIDLVATLHDLLRSYRAAWRDIDFSEQFSESPVFSDFSKLEFERSVSNIINNSIDAVVDNQIRPAKIEVLLQKNDRQVEIHFQDNGPGIPDAYRSKIFESGFTLGKKSGTGLGLAQAMKSVRDRGGQLELVRSDIGAHFKMTLPFIGIREKIEVNGVLIFADDSEEILHQWESKAARFKSRTHLFKNPLECLRFVQGLTAQKRPFTLITDLIFQGYDETGFDIINECRGTEFAKAFLCTSLSDNSEVNSIAKGYGALVIPKARLGEIELVDHSA